MTIEPAIDLVYAHARKDARSTMKILPMLMLAVAVGCNSKRTPGPAGDAQEKSDGGAVLIEAAEIAGGSPRWVDSNRDPRHALINARVDVGTLKQIGGEIEVSIRFPLGAGLLRDAESTHPGLHLPQGTAELDRERIRCGRDRLQYYAVETWLVAPDGKVMDHQIKDPAASRQHEEDVYARMSKTGFQFARYGASPRDLVCWAVARKCSGEPFIWPPPPNDTRFDDPEYARKRDDHDTQFVPSCALP